MITFANPAWFILVPLLAAAGWQWRGLGLHRPLRAACLGLVVVLLADPQVRRFGDGLDLWLLVDRSESADDALAPRLREWETILLRAKGPDDRIRPIDFAAEAVTRGALLRAGAGAVEYAGGRAETRLRTAIDHALAEADPKRATRLLALTDGYSTEPLSGAAEKLLDRGVVLDLRIPPPRTENDYRIARLDVPPRVQPRESLLLAVEIRGGADARVPLEVLRDDEPIGSLTVDVAAGSGRIRFTDRLATPGAHRYEVRIAPEDDAHPANNAASRWIEIIGGRRVLLVTTLLDDPIATVLRGQGLDVEVVDDPSRAHVGMLAGAAAVILNNVPASVLDRAFVAALDFYVTSQGGGLAMIGGRHAFAAGGWFASPVDPLLPVSMELKQEHRRLATVMAIVIDRSGSMTATVGNGVQKIELAGEGAARSIELLGGSDLVALIPVDSAAHPITPVAMPVAANRDALARAARSIHSEGGGIFCHVGLEAAWKMIRDVPVGQRHVIFFADAADAEEPGAYRTLLAEMVAGGCTVSVIGLGSRGDQDGDLLVDIAARGQGRIFFSADAGELPALFEMETATVARSAFLTEPVEVRATPGWLELAAQPLEWPVAVDAYNLCYLRPEASVAAVTGDDYAAPLLAFWQRGAGRTAAVTFPLGGEHSAATRAWPAYGDAVQTLCRWLVGPEPPAGVGLRTSVEGTGVRFDLFHDDSWAERFAAVPPRLAVARAGAEGTVAVPWERLSPGHYAATVDAAGIDFLRAAVGLGEAALAAGPINVANNPEWSFDPRRLAESRAVARRSGGGEPVDLTDIWAAPRPPAHRSLQRWLLPLLSLLLLAEALQTQTGLRWRAWPGRARGGTGP
ncbi:MAG: hypothetical protein ACKOCW_01370 [Planctomycetaceae bacterium]